MNSDTFDPNIYKSSAEALETLRGEGININHRLCARICALARRPILFSWAFLEEAADSQDFAKCLQDKRWNEVDLEDLKKIQEILDPLEAKAQYTDGVLKVFTADEDIVITSTALTLKEENRGSILPQVMGLSDPSALKGILWDRQRLEESSLALLDSEDTAQLIESFRYLFRASVTCGQDPMGLLVTALKRGKKELSLEVTRQVRDNLNRDLGRALENLLSEDPKKFKDALYYFNRPEQERFKKVLQVILLPALLPMVKQETFRSQLLPSLCHISPLIESVQELTPFLDALLDDLDSMELSERFAISGFIFDLAYKFKDLKGYLLKRFQSTNVSNDLAFLGNILARLTLEDEEFLSISDRLVELFITHGTDIGLARRLRVTFRFLGTYILSQLSEANNMAKLSEAQRMFVVALWNDFRLAGSEHKHEDEHDESCDCAEEELISIRQVNKFNLSLDSEELKDKFADFVINRLLEKDKSATLALIHTKQLDLPEVKEILQNLDNKRYSIYSFLFEEACYLASPDNELVLQLLASCGSGALEFSFKVVSEDAALESGGEARKIATLGLLLQRIDKSNSQVKARVDEMIAQALHFPSLFARPQHPILPIVWQSLGNLASVAGIEENLRQAALDRLVEDLSNYPQEKIEAMLAIYRQAGQEIKSKIESSLRQILQDPQPDRKVLKYSLEGLYKLLQDGPMLVDIEKLISMLCRTVLSKASEPSLEEIMRQMLSDNAQGDGTQFSVAWNHEDRTMALKIVGAAACHKDASERLHRLFVYRLFSFLDDWFQGIERGKNLYAYRGNPIWAFLSELLVEDTSEFTADLARTAAVRLMSDYGRRLEGCDLAQSETAQKFLLAVLRVNREKTYKVNGVEVNLSNNILRTMMEVTRNSPPENKVSFNLLHELVHEDILPKRTKEDLHLFLIAMERE
ncbi:hypothetical protein IJT10_05240 [bacterium]|nr:hypothetical protein [bacterium]